MSKAMKLPSHYLGAQAATPGQNVVLTSTVANAATALLSYLQANGCSRNSLPVVSDFQTAYNDAGLPGQLSVDGQYGPNSQAALQAVSDQLNGDTAPDNCFPELGPVPAIPRLDTPSPAPVVVVPPANPPAPAPSTNVTVTSGTSGAFPWIIGGAIVLAAGIAGWAWYAKGGGKQMLVRKSARRKIRRIKRSRRK